MAQLQFDANNYEPSRPGIQQLPISDENGHLVTIVKSDVTATKDGQNGMLVLTYQIIEGEHSGASGVCRLNIYHQSEQTAEIAYKQLSAICHCTGVMQLADSSQLHNIPHRVLVRKQTNDDRYTEIYGWLHADGNLPGQGGAQAPQNNQPQDSNPWGGGSSPAQNSAPSVEQNQAQTPPWGQTQTNVPVPGQGGATAQDSQSAGENTPPWKR